MVPGPQAWEVAGRGEWWGKKARASVSRQRLAAHVCVNVRTRVFVYVHAWKMARGEEEPAGDNDGNRRDRYALAREKDRGETGSDG